MDAEKKETKEINKMSLLIMAVVVLLLIIAGAAYYIFHQNQQMEDLEQAYVLDKESLEDEFNELSLQYEGYKFNIGNDSLLNLLSTEQAKVQRLQEELRTVKATNTKEIARLKKELQTLRKIMRNYVVQIDSLNRANEQLKVEKNEAVKKYKQASGYHFEEGKRETDGTCHIGKPFGCDGYQCNSCQWSRKKGKGDQEDGTICR